MTTIPFDGYGYTREDVVQMVETYSWELNWTDPPQPGNFCEWVKEIWPDLFERAMTLKRETTARIAEGEVKLAALRMRMLLPPEELTEREQKVQRLWRGWGFTTYFTPKESLCP